MTSTHGCNQTQRIFLASADEIINLNDATLAELRNHRERLQRWHHAAAVLELQRGTVVVLWHHGHRRCARVRGVIRWAIAAKRKHCADCRHLAGVVDAVYDNEIRLSAVATPQRIAVQSARRGGLGADEHIEIVVRDRERISRTPRDVAKQVLHKRVRNLRFEFCGDAAREYVTRHRGWRRRSIRKYTVTNASRNECEQNPRLITQATRQHVQQMRALSCTHGCRSQARAAVLRRRRAVAAAAPRGTSDGAAAAGAAAASTLAAPAAPLHQRCTSVTKGTASVQND